MSPPYSAQTLEKAGASLAFVKVYSLDVDKRNSVREEMKKSFNSPESVGENPDIGGHFFAALWRGNCRKAWSRADPTNRVLMEKAGLKPHAP